MLRVKKLSPDAKLPTKAHAGDLGYDLYCLEDTTILKDTITLVRTGIACGFPAGYGGIIKDRSSVATKMRLEVWAGVIDNAYIGEIKVAFYNPFTTQVFSAGDKIAQMVLVATLDEEVVEVDDLIETSRGDKGFGSTGT
jgi:dUTP pyrophosphatase